MEKININNFTLNELEEYIVFLDEKKFHAKQIFKWIHKLGVTSFDEMTDISKSLRDKLKEKTYILNMEIITCQKSKKDGTMKFLINLEDSSAIESVFMRYNHGNTLCVSTQVGCKMGCKFCASTKEGFERNLNAAEIEYGLNIGARHISLSTCGIVPKIYKLAEENIQCTLSISLHATSDEKRRDIMPIANRYTIEELLNACKEYIKITGRRISFEYALIYGKNDSYEDALALAKLLRGMIAHVNLIPVNEIKEKEYKKATEKSIEKFMNTLNSMGIVTTVRRELGSDIDAACGQLRRKYIERKKNS